MQKKIILLLVAVLLAFSGTVTAFASTDDSYFDDVVFVGDSISLQLQRYVAKKRNTQADFLGGAQFLTAGGLGSGNVQLPIDAASLHPTYQGEKMMLEDSIAATGAKKVYLMFGMNDIHPYGVTKSVKNLDQLIHKILEVTPDAQIVVQSVTPVLYDKQQRRLNNANILSYNQALEAYCNESGYLFLDVGSLFRTDDGNLMRRYCSDPGGMGMHLNNNACVPWLDYLRENPIPQKAADEGAEVEGTEEMSEDLTEEGAKEPTEEGDDSENSEIISVDILEEE